jgi:hypothetical protein
MPEGNIGIVERQKRMGHRQSGGHHRSLIEHALGAVGHAATLPVRNIHDSWAQGHQPPQSMSTAPHSTGVVFPAPTGAVQAALMLRRLKMPTTPYGIPALPAFPLEGYTKSRRHHARG